VRTICTSIHKWIPSPNPSSILILKDKKYLPNSAKSEAYIMGRDFTFGTSRSGHAPLFTWDYLQHMSLSEHVEEAYYSKKMTDYLFE
jgi:glutamate/tyrosine decarboxylase-like PLP-dependent enzyme